MEQKNRLDTSESLSREDDQQIADYLRSSVANKCLSSEKSEHWDHVYMRDGEMKRRSEEMKATLVKPSIRACVALSFGRPNSSLKLRAASGMPHV